MFEAVPKDVLVYVCMCVCVRVHIRRTVQLYPWDAVRTLLLARAKPNYLTTA